MAFCVLLFLRTTGAAQITLPGILWPIKEPEEKKKSVADLKFGKLLLKLELMIELWEVMYRLSMCLYGILIIKHLPSLSLAL